MIQSVTSRLTDLAIGQPALRVQPLHHLFQQWHGVFLPR